ncbi:MAG: acetyl-CoA carboxylase subunit alpha [Gammaproteobacteria bacterium]|jgi:acetyl-CoA carboxylase carboxyl transferase subunit alpha|nr:acetyl-CoA carboxylase subunit alpha [Gammaproteobacteria bacterium]
MQFLDFEQPIAELEAKIDALRKVEHGSEVNINEEIKKLEEKSKKLTASVFSTLTDWQVIQLARHPHRPYSLDYIEYAFTDFDELHGDRSFADDPAIVGGLARIDDQPVMVIGQQKGRTTKEKLFRNFGMPHPEGYRKALRLMKMAEQFNLPVITLIDTPGAYPGVNAEARGQSEAIARNLREMSVLKVPVICAVIGEGCSGGALGIGVGDVLLMFEYSYFATISPEGCASILWKSAEKAPQAAEIMGITAGRLKKLKVVDQIIKEPLGGAHRNPQAAAESLKKAILAELSRLQALSTEQLLEQRYQKLMEFGRFEVKE